MGSKIYNSEVKYLENLIINYKNELKKWEYKESHDIIKDYSMINYYKNIIKTTEETIISYKNKDNEFILKLLDGLKALKYSN